MQIIGDHIREDMDMNMLQNNNVSAHRSMFSMLEICVFVISYKLLPSLTYA